MSGADVAWELAADEHLWMRNGLAVEGGSEIPLIVLLRVRNEELILADTLQHLTAFADLIVAYDDASTDGTRSILRNHPKVALIVENQHWLENIDDRQLAETRHRGLLLHEARRRWCFRWCMCCDADERYVGSIREFVTAPGPGPAAVRVQLFDAYITETDCRPYIQGMPLLDFRKFFGPERRDILMLWRNSDAVVFRGLDAREPDVPGEWERRFYCQHFGKSLSVEHWETTCDYYVNHFPYEPYGKKWSARKGKAIHSESDFGRKLFSWGDELFQNAVVMS